MAERRAREPIAAPRLLSADEWSEYIVEGAHAPAVPSEEKKLVTRLGSLRYPMIAIGGVGGSHVRVGYDGKQPVESALLLVLLVGDLLAPSLSISTVTLSPRKKRTASCSSSRSSPTRWPFS